MGKTLKRNRVIMKESVLTYSFSCLFAHNNFAIKSVSRDSVLKKKIKQVSGAESCDHSRNGCEPTR